MLKRTGAGFTPPETPAISIELEQALLGAVLTDNTVYFTVTDLIEAEYFSEPLHRTIWELIGKRLEEGGRVNPTLLAADLGSDAGVTITGGLDAKGYVARVAAEAVGTMMAADYAREIASLWRVRRLRALGEDLVVWADSGAEREPVEEMIRETDSDLQEIAFGRHMGNIRSLGDAVSEALAQTEDAYRKQAEPGLSFGLPSLDRLCGRMMPGDFIVLVAPSGHGKTALLTQILCSVSNPSANPVVPSYMIELEMAGRDIARRLLARHGRVPVSAQETAKFKGQPISEEEYGRLVDAAVNLRRIPVFIDDRGGGAFTRVSKITARIRAMVKLRGVKLVGIDHDKLLTTSNPKWGVIEIITNAARKFKQLAMEQQIPIIHLAQVTRESRKRDSESLRPRAEDIYGGEVLKECADIILGLHHPTEGLVQREPPESERRDHDKWVQEMERWKGFVEVSALKRRRGRQTGWVRLAYNGPTTTFSEPSSGSG